MRLIIRFCLLSALLVLSVGIACAQGLPTEKLEPTPAAHSEDKSAALNEPEKDTTVVSSVAREKIDAARKQDRKDAEGAEKERLKRPEQIQIKAPADKVRGLIMRWMTVGWNYTLAQDSINSLLFTRDITGARGTMLQVLTGDVYRNPRHVMSFTISDFEGETTVTVNLSNISGNARAEMNKNKEWRRQTRDALEQVKAKAEAP